MPACFVICLLVVYSGISQDSLQRKVKFSLSGNIWMQSIFETNSAVRMPSYIKDLRGNATRLPINFDSLTDNPLRHGASYIVVQSSANFKNKVRLNVDLYAEQRGASYGIFSKKNLLVYPVFNITAEDSIKFSNDFVLFRGRAGMFLNEKLDEGLTIYNIDAQGMQITIQKNKWLIEGTLYGDFSRGIGLNIDDMYAIALKRRSEKNDSAEAGISINYNKQYIPSNFSKSNWLFHVFGHKNFNHSKVYVQAGFRPGNEFVFQASESFKDKIAALLGFEYRNYKKGFNMNVAMEARYYGSIFNEGYYDFSLRYRDTATNIYEMYDNTVGPYLYPLRKFSTNFSQWAVFTEYYFNRVFSVNLRGSLNQDIGKKTSVGLKYDLMFIRAKDNFSSTADPPPSRFLYPFFTANISYRIIREVETSLLLTNQSMNLDVSYPTHYLLSHPRFGIRLSTSF